MDLCPRDILLAVQRCYCHLVEMHSLAELWYPRTLSTGVVYNLEIARTLINANCYVTKPVDFDQLPPK